MGNYNTMKNLFLKHGFVIFFISLFFGLSFFSTNGISVLNDSRFRPNSITSDEASHLPAGIYYLNAGRYLINPEHPPLVKIVAALPFLNSDIKLPVFSDSKESENDNILPKETELRNYGQWDFGNALLSDPDNDMQQILLSGRLAVLVFNLFLLILVYFYLVNIFGLLTSRFFIIFFTTSATIIAHSSLVTTDISSALLQILSLLSFGLFLHKPKARNGFLAVIFFSGAQLAKFSSVLLLPAFFMVIVLFMFKNKNPLKSLINFFLLFVASILIITLFYIPFTINVTESEFVSRLTDSAKNYDQSYVRIAESFVNINEFTKSIAHYLYGVLLAFFRGAGGNSLFFLGEVYKVTSGVLYFPILYFLKQAEGYILILLVTFGFILSYTTRKIISQRDKITKLRKIAHNLFLKYDSFFGKFSYTTILLALFFFIYLITSLISKLQIGVRHITVIILISFIFTSFFASFFYVRSKTFKNIFKISFVLILVSLFLNFPFYLSYYNLFAGGTENGYKIAVDSNYDWGQDLYRFESFLIENNIENVFYDFFVAKSAVQKLSDKFNLQEINYETIQDGEFYFAISIQMYYSNQLELAGQSKVNFERMTQNLVGRAGLSIFVYKFTP